MKLIITRTKYCISLYDEHQLDGLDLFPNDELGMQMLLKQVEDYLNPEINETEDSF